MTNVSFRRSPYLLDVGVCHDIERLSQFWDSKTEPSRNAAEDYIKYIVRLYIPKSQRQEYLTKWEDEKRN